MPRGERRLAAIMFTDMVGYTALAQEDEPLAIELLDEQRSILRPFFPKYGGREVRTNGDAFLVQFKSVLEAVKCATDIQQSLHELNTMRSSKRRITLRIGVHVGDIIEEVNDIHGDAVNIASRMEPLAAPGGVCISEQAYDQIRNKIAFPMVKLEKQPLKNVRVPMDVFRVVMPWDETQQREDESWDRKRLAILPFNNISPNPDDEYFADGMTEELITTISMITGLTVIARTSVMRYKGLTKGIVDIGRELSVGTILEGTVRKAMNRLRITVQLIDVQSQGHLWGQSYDRDFDDIFTVQSDVAQRVARALKIRLSAKEKKQVERKPTESTEAFTLYLKGRHHWNERTKEALDRAVRFFEEAIEVDPDYALAYAGLADCYLVFGDQGSLPTSKAFTKAKGLVSKTLELDDGIAEAHATLGGLLFHEWDWAGSERELKRAIELKPNYATAHHWYSLYLNVIGRHGEAMMQIKEAQQLDPLSPVIQVHIGLQYYHERRYNEAINQLKHVLETDPTFYLAHYYLGMVYAVRSMFNEALLEIQKAKVLSPAAFWLNDILAYSFAMSGRKKDATKIVTMLLERSRMEYVSPFIIAEAYVGLDKDKAFEWLERAYEWRDSGLTYLKGVQLLDGLHSDARYAALLRKMGLKK